MKKSEILLEAPLLALASLDKALAQPKNEFTRDAVIQRFEYTFELCWKTLRRYLEKETNTQEYNLKDLFRAAGKQGLINSVDAWFEYHKGRNLTTHTYHEKTAEETYEIAKKFALDARQLLNSLDKHLKNANQSQ
jgi:nucleotidyltransferase substrate binding protein (TIGR01987 family)